MAQQVTYNEDPCKEFWPQAKKKTICSQKDVLFDSRMPSLINDVNGIGKKIYLPEYLFLLPHIKVKMTRNAQIISRPKAAFVQRSIQIVSIKKTSGWYKTMDGTAEPSRNYFIQWLRRFLENSSSWFAQIREAANFYSTCAKNWISISWKFLYSIESSRTGAASSEIQNLWRSKKKLKMLPYKLSFLQELLPREYGERLQWV